MDEENSTELNVTDVLESTYNIGEIEISAQELIIFYWGSGILTVFIISLIIAFLTKLSFPKDAFQYLAIQHILIGYLHIMCITFYNHFTSSIWTELAIEISSYLDIISVNTTSCIAWIILLRLFLFRNGEELYSPKEITIFSTLFISVTQCYEYIFYVLYDDGSLTAVLRLTTCLLLMCVPVSVFCLIIICVITNLALLSLPRASYNLVHIFLLLCSDIIFLKFNFYSVNEFKILWDVLLNLRIVVEIVWLYVNYKWLYELYY